MKPRSTFPAGFALALVLSLGGCFTIMDATKIPGGPVVYGGLRMWFGNRGNGYQLLLWVTVAAPLIDIPLCLLADTALLPVTLTRSTVEAVQERRAQHARAEASPRNTPPPAREARPTPRPRRLPRAVGIPRKYAALRSFSRARVRDGKLGEGYYESDLRVEATDGDVEGAGTERTILAGSLVLIGRGHVIRGLRVRGDVLVIWGGGHDLRGCAIEGRVQVLGRGEVQVPEGVPIVPYEAR